MEPTKPITLVERLTAIGDSLREATGDEKKYTLEEMAARAKELEEVAAAYVLVDADGNEYGAVMVDEEIEVTATPDDVREGVTFVSDEGVDVGEKYIPSYETHQGALLVPAGRNVTIVGLNVRNCYDYTKFQSIICLFNTDLSNSVAAEIVSIDDNVYNVKTTDAISAITINHDNKSVDLGITNNFDVPCIVRYFTYKEV